jgi:hypothetical protein
MTPIELMQQALLHLAGERDGLGHLKHIQLLDAKNWLQFVIGDDFTLILWVLEFVFLDVRPNLFRDLAARKRFCADNFG